jgi:hypothetical protein
MKIKLMFKTPDVISNYTDNILDSTDKEFEEVAKDLEEIREACEKFIEYGEYCTIEIDTKTQEARVVPV